MRIHRRRFEAAHLKYAILVTQARYPELATDPTAMTTDVTDTLQTWISIGNTCKNGTYTRPF